MINLIATLYFAHLYWKRVPSCLVSTKLDRLYACKLVCLFKTLELSRDKEKVTVVMINWKSFLRYSKLVTELISDWISSQHQIPSYEL